MHFIHITAKRDIVLDSQLPQGMSGEKLKELERGPVSHALPEEAPLSPPKFITQVGTNHHVAFLD